MGMLTICWCVSALEWSMLQNGSECWWNIMKQWWLIECVLFCPFFRQAHGLPRLAHKDRGQNNSQSQGFDGPVVLVLLWILLLQEPWIYLNIIKPQDILNFKCLKHLKTSARRAKTERSNRSKHCLHSGNIHQLGLPCLELSKKAGLPGTESWQLGSAGL